VQVWAWLSKTGLSIFYHEDQEENEEFAIALAPDYTDCPDY
jgi:hypothetical protein